MGNKKKRVNTDPTMSMIRDIFQENLQLVNRVQRKSKSDIVTKYDLTEKLCARRMKAVAHLMPEMQERYAKTYPEIDIKSEFADIASLPVLSYDIIDEESYLCLGAAIWMLDQIWEEHEMQELCDLLPEECDYVDTPDVYDARFSDEIIEGMLWAVQNRYGETDRYVVQPNIFSKKNDSVFHKIFDMIPDISKEAAAAQLKSKFWEWADLYFKALSPLVHEMRRQEENLDRLTDQIEKIQKKYFPKKQARPTLPLTAPLPLFDDIPIKNQKLEADMLMCQIDKAEEAHNNISKKIGDFRFTGLQASVMSKDRLIKCMNADLAEAMYNFSIEDPYELCFAILYLFDQDDDYAWVYAGSTITNKLETLMAGGCIVQRVDENLTYDYLHSSEDNLWSMLYLTGYLTKARNEQTDEVLPDGAIALMIPNEEIRDIFETTVIQWFDDSTRKWNRTLLFDAVWNGDSVNLTKEMNILLRRTISYHDYKEDFYHAFLAGIFTGAGYMVDSNKEHGEGRSDVVVYDPVNGRVAIFEAKYTKNQEKLESTCNTALQQIDERLYAKEYEDDYDQILCYGISFFKKRCLVKIK